jgi:5-formyltetrahydrofolate cyclo-ligase
MHVDYESGGVYGSMILRVVQGVKEHSKKISLKDKVTIDLVIVGSVAVSREGEWFFFFFLLN